jgi:heme-degrading monooxygenase HmoA
MYARVTLLEIDVLRADMDEVLERYRRELLPEIQSQPGYEGMFVLATSEGQGLVMSLWSDEDALDASAQLAAGAADRFTTIYRSAPGRESYEVRLADVPALAVD